MNCPNCGRSNPDDRDVCYNCDQPLPRRKEAPKRNNQTGRMGAMTWVVLVVLGVLFFLQSCMHRPATIPPASSVSPGIIQVGHGQYPLT
jgi:predicted nucleic acid-binding Zn ribbon protein